MGLRSLPTLLLQTLDGLIAVRARVLKFGSGLTFVDNADGTSTLTASGGGSVATDAIWDAKGDLAVGTGANTAAKLTVSGNNGWVLTEDSGETTGTKWAAAGGGGGAATSVEMDVINFSGFTLTAGTPVVDNGNVDVGGSNFVIVNRTAGANQNDQVIGCVKTTIANNATGTVVTFGPITSVDTTAYVDYDELFLDVGAGNVTNSAPAGDQTTRYAIVVVANSASGSIFVLPQVWSGSYRHQHQDQLGGGLLLSPEITVGMMMTEVSTPSTPAAGKQIVYIDVSDHKLKRKDSSAAVTIIG